MPCHLHSRFFQYHLLSSASFRGVNADHPLIMLFLCLQFFFSTSTKLSSISFDLKKYGKVREIVENFKETKMYLSE